MCKMENTGGNKHQMNALESKGLANCSTKHPNQNTEPTNKTKASVINCKRHSQI